MDLMMSKVLLILMPLPPGFIGQDAWADENRSPAPDTHPRKSKSSLATAAALTGCIQAWHPAHRRQPCHIDNLFVGWRKVNHLCD